MIDSNDCSEDNKRELFISNLPESRTHLFTLAKDTGSDFIQAAGGVGAGAKKQSSNDTGMPSTQSSGENKNNRNQAARLSSRRRVQIEEPTNEASSVKTPTVLINVIDVRDCKVIGRVHSGGTCLSNIDGTTWSFTRVKSPLEESMGTQKFIEALDSI